MTECVILLVELGPRHRPSIESWLLARPAKNVYMGPGRSYLKGSKYFGSVAESTQTHFLFETFRPATKEFDPTLFIAAVDQLSRAQMERFFTVTGTLDEEPEDAVYLGYHPYFWPENPAQIIKNVFQDRFKTLFPGSHLKLSLRDTRNQEATLYLTNLLYLDDEKPTEDGQLKPVDETFTQFTHHGERKFNLEEPNWQNLCTKATEELLDDDDYFKHISEVFDVSISSTCHLTPLQIPLNAPDIRQILRADLLLTEHLFSQDFKLRTVWWLKMNALLRSEEYRNRKLQQVDDKTYMILAVNRRQLRSEIEMEFTYMDRNHTMVVEFSTVNPKGDDKCSSPFVVEKILPSKYFEPTQSKWTFVTDEPLVYRKEAKHRGLYDPFAMRHRQLYHYHFGLMRASYIAAYSRKTNPGLSLFNTASIFECELAVTGDSVYDDQRLVYLPAPCTTCGRKGVAMTGNDLTVLQKPFNCEQDTPEDRENRAKKQKLIVKKRIPQETCCQETARNPVCVQLTNFDSSDTILNPTEDMLVKFLKHGSDKRLVYRRNAPMSKSDLLRPAAILWTAYEIGDTIEIFETENIPQLEETFDQLDIARSTPYVPIPLENPYSKGDTCALTQYETGIGQLDRDIHEALTYQAEPPPFSVFLPSRFIRVWVAADVESR